MASLASVSEFDQAHPIGQLVFKPAHGRERGLELLALTHEALRLLRLVPDGRVFGFGVQFVETAKGLVPVKDASSAGTLPA